MGNLVFQATLGGQVNLVGPNTASTYNINVPTVNGNLVTTGDTGTVTNTMLAGSIANAKLTNSSVTIGSTSISLGATSTTLVGLTSVGTTTVGAPSSSNLSIQSNGATNATLDTSGNLGLGVTPSAWQSYLAFQMNAGSILSYSTNDYRMVQNTLRSGGAWKYINNGYANAYLQDGSSGGHAWFNAPSGTAGNAITFTQAMTLDASGNLLVGTTTKITAGVGISVGSATNSGLDMLTVKSSSTAKVSFAVNATDSENFNTGTACAAVFGRNAGSGRSVNAGGTLNANGADYAEYMTKAGNFTIAKGDVCGIDAQGKLTNVFDDAVSFVVKSTDPSFVGGDKWSSAESIGMSKPIPVADDATDEEKTQYETDLASFESALEAARQLVDRIAFSGQVPVNVTGATAGQYIIPVNDNGAIKGQAVSNPTSEQYQIAVGKVIAIEQDGRAKIIVKVA